MSADKVNYEEAFINFNPQRFCDQLGRIMSKNSDYEITYTLIPKESEEADEN